MKFVHQKKSLRVLGECGLLVFLALVSGWSPDDLFVTLSAMPFFLMAGVMATGEPEEIIRQINFNGNGGGGEPPTHEAEEEKTSWVNRRARRSAERERYRTMKQADREKIKAEKRREKIRRRKMRMPLSSYWAFLPCIGWDFLPGVLHAAVYNEVIGPMFQGMLIAKIPVIGQVTQLIDPNLSFSGVLVILMTAIVLLAPVFFFLTLSRLNFAENGLDVFEDNPASLVELGIPLGVYGLAGFLEFGMLWQRFEMDANKTIVFGDKTVIPPEALIVTAILAFVASSVVGYWGSKKLEVFLDEKQRRIDANPYTPDTSSTTSYRIGGNV